MSDAFDELERAEAKLARWESRMEASERERVALRQETSDANAVANAATERGDTYRNRALALLGQVKHWRLRARNRQYQLAWHEARLAAATERQRTAYREGLEAAASYIETHVFVEPDYSGYRGPMVDTFAVLEIARSNNPKLAAIAKAIRALAATVDPSE